MIRVGNLEAAEVGALLVLGIGREDLLEAPVDQQLLAQVSGDMMMLPISLPKQVTGMQEHRLER